ncbi:MAG: hypothetical protein RR954_09955 [Christensenellaceae bacterium]
MNKWKILSLIVTICMVVSLTACKDKENRSNTPADVTECFFSAFESSDYAAMKTYCTENCIEYYFHDGDVNGMVWAKLTESGEERIVDDHMINLFVTVEMETAKTSALYPETETSFYVELIQNDTGSWLINGFPTG